MSFSAIFGMYKLLDKDKAISHDSLKHRSSVEISKEALKN
jgi:hypothetical protein